MKITSIFREKPLDKNWFFYRHLPQFDRKIKNFAMHHAHQTQCFKKLYFTLIRHVTIFSRSICIKYLVLVRYFIFRTNGCRLNSPEMKNKEKLNIRFVFYDTQTWQNQRYKKIIWVSELDDILHFIKSFLSCSKSSFLFHTTKKNELLPGKSRNVIWLFLQ